MRFFSNLSIKTQLILLICISILPALGIIIYSGVEQHQNNIKQIHSSAIGLMHNMVDRQQIITENSRQLIITLSRIQEVQTLNIPACATLFKELLPENPIYANIFMLSKEGIVLASGVPTKKISLRGRKYFKDAMATRSFSTGEYLVAIITKKSVFTYSYPIINRQGEVKGVLALSLDLQRYNDFISASKLPEAFVLELSDHKGTRLYRYPEGKKYTGLPDRPDLMEHMSGDSDEGTFFAKGADGIKRFYAYKKFRLSKQSPPYLYMRIGIPEQKAYQEVWSITKRNLLILGGVFVLALAFSWFLGSYLIANPISRLTLFTNRFRSGEQDMTTGLPHTENEIGQLAKSFDKMTLDLMNRDAGKKKAEEDLRRMVERFDLATQAASLGVWDWDLQKDELVWDDQMYQLYGTQKDEFQVAYETWLKGIHPDDLARSIEISQQAVRGEWEYDTEFRVLWPDGSVHWLKANGKIHRDDNGVPLRIVGVNYDITERKRAEESVQLEKGNLHTIFSSSPVAMLVLDEKMNIVLANPAAKSIAKKSYEDMLQRLPGEALDCAHRFDDPRGCGHSSHCLLCPLHNAIHMVISTSAALRNIELSLELVRDGSPETVWLVINAEPIVLNSQRQVIVALNEITEMKTMEKQFYEAQKMEVMGVLAGGIAHDFNNILGSLMGYAGMSAEATDESDRQHCMEQVMKSCDRATNLVKQILAFSRHSDSERKPMDLRVIVKESLKLLGSTIPATVKMQTQITDKMCTIHADPTQMHQIIMNLCTNAAHAMGEKGGILEVSLVHEKNIADVLPNPGDLKPGSYIKLSVSDNGPGIDPAIMNRIFDPFFTTKKVGEGTGLGLSVVHGIVKNHEGTVIASSTLGEGTNFTVYIPSAENAEVEQQISSHGVTPRGDERILFVDDEKVLAEMGHRMLFSLGYEVTIITDSREALNTFRANPEKFDLIITDMTMPNMTGKDLAREIMECRPDMPVILCTGYSEYVTEEQAKQLGIKAMLMKPFTRKDLAGVVRETLDNKL